MNKERAAAYLASGCSQGQVASIMGCSPGYIAQLMKDEEFQKLIISKRDMNDGSEEKEVESIQQKYTGLEHQLIKAMGDALGNAELPAITRALEVVATRQEKAAVRRLPAGHPANGQRGIGNTVVVQLMLPGHAIPQQPIVEYNQKNEVVAIDGKSMSPMSSGAVEKMFKERKAEVLVAEAREKVEKAIEGSAFSVPSQQKLDELLKEI